MNKTFLFSNNINIWNFNKTIFFIELRDGYLVCFILFYLMYLKTFFKIV